MSITEQALRVWEDKERAVTREIDAVDALEFVRSEQYLNEIPTAFQSVVLKTVYGLWLKYGVESEDEQRVLDILKDTWGITIDIHTDIRKQTHIWVLGRRSGKSSLLSFIAAYSAYQLICLYNPQAHFGIRLRNPIFITHMAASGEQAENMFQLTSDNIRKCEFFRPYIDFNKVNSSEIALFTPYDLAENERISRHNKNRTQGLQRETLLEGSIVIRSITTSSKTKRGDAIYTLMLSEFAHFERAKMEGITSDDQYVSENPRADYAVAKAMIPSVLDFGADGLVIMESSPVEKGGEFYSHYCMGGGKEQENWKDVTPDPNYQVIQMATWEARPVITRESLEPKFRKDPVGSNMEYGAHFGNPSGNFISLSMIEAIPQPNIARVFSNPNTQKYIISIDPGGKAKKKKADTYMIAWGHYDVKDSTVPESGYDYWIDGMQGFDSNIKALGGGKYEQISVDPNTVVEYIINLVQGLGGRNFIQEIVFDQFESSNPVATLQHLGYPAVETTFTNQYKAEMYGNYLAKALQGQVKMYGIDEGGWIARWKLEMKYLQQENAGAYVYYHHPFSGPVQHDDCADVTANLIHRLILHASPTKEYIKDARRSGIGPLRVRQGPTIRKIPALWGGGRRGAGNYRK